MPFIPTKRKHNNGLDISLGGLNSRMKGDLIIDGRLNVKLGGLSVGLDNSFPDILVDFLDELSVNPTFVIENDYTHAGELHGNLAVGLGGLNMWAKPTAAAVPSINVIDGKFNVKFGGLDSTITRIKYRKFINNQYLNEKISLGGLDLNLGGALTAFSEVDVMLGGINVYLGGKLIEPKVVILVIYVHSGTANQSNQLNPINAKEFAIKHIMSVGGKSLPFTNMRYLSDGKEKTIEGSVVFADTNGNNEQIIKDADNNNSAVEFSVDENNKKRVLMSRMHWSNLTYSIDTIGQSKLLNISLVDDDIFKIEPSTKDIVLYTRQDYPDIAGNNNDKVDYIPHTQLTLYSVLDYLVNKINATAWRSNIPNFDISKVSFNLGGSFIEPILELIKTFKPIVYKDISGNVHFISTLIKPTSGDIVGLIHNTNYTSISSSTSKDVSSQDGYVVKYNVTKNNYDYTRQRIVNDIEKIGRQVDLENYVELRKTYTYTDYYSNAVSDKPIQSLLTNFETRTFKYNRNIFKEVSRETESSVYNNLNIISRSQKTLKNINNDGILDTIQRSDTVYTYSTSALNNNSTVLIRQVKNSYSKFVEDGDSSFNYLDALRGGLDISASTPTLRKSKTEIIEYVEKSKFEVTKRTKIIDYMVQPNQVVYSNNETLPASVVVDNSSGKRDDYESLIIKRVGSTQNKYGVINIGDVPLNVVKPVIENLIETPVTVIELKMVSLYDDILEIGNYFKIFDEDGSLLDGVYILASISISGEALGQLPKERTIYKLKLLRVPV